MDARARHELHRLIYLSGIYLFISQGEGLLAGWLSEFGGMGGGGGDAMTISL